MRFDSPEFLLLLAGPILVFIAWSRLGKQRPATLIFSSLKLLPAIPKSGKVKKNILLGIRVGGLIFLVIALARPQGGRTTIDRTAEGIDIMLALDVSSSMTAEDFHPENRLRVAKDVLKKFVEKRISDRIGLVIFAGTSFTQCPLTLDYDVLSTFIESIDFAWEWDGTAIGMAVANSLARLKDSDAKSKVIVLLTDGVNNRGEINPLTAAQMAQALGIRIYAIGAGTQGTAPVIVKDRMGRLRKIRHKVEIDEETLIKMAETTGGQYFRAKDAEALSQIYNRINELERTEIEVTEHVSYNDIFYYPLILGLIFLLGEILLRLLIFRRIP